MINKTISQAFVVDKEYVGQYIATPSFNDKTVIAHGNDLQAVMQQACEQGYSSPFVLFVPDHHMNYLYSVLN